MTKTTRAITTAALALTMVTGIASAYTQDEMAAQQAHDAYLDAINSNDLETFLTTVTDDIVFIAPNSDAIVGKAQVGPWVGGYFEAFDTKWQKTSLEFVVSGDWAFERYSYKVIDTARDGGEAYTDTGNGINIYRLGSDGIWRVARDAWATSQPLPGN